MADEHKISFVEMIDNDPRDEAFYHMTRMEYVIAMPCLFMDDRESTSLKYNLAIISAMHDSGLLTVPQMTQIITAMRENANWLDDQMEAAKALRLAPVVTRIQ